MLRLITAAAVLVAIGGAPAAGAPAVGAAAVTGNILYEFCTAGAEDACLLYIAGVADGAVLASSAVRQAGGQPVIEVCPPEGHTYRQIRDMVVKRLREHPEHRELAASIIIMDTLAAAWPCS